MNFGAALKQLKIGIRITRKHWNDIGTSIVIDEARAEIVQVARDGYKSHWYAKHSDLLAEDWEIVVPPVAGERPQSTEGPPETGSPT